MPRAKSRASGGGRSRGGRRPLSQRARARGIGVKPARGRDVRTERAREHEGHELERGHTEPRRSRAQAQPSHSEYAHEASRSTARQRRTKATELEKRRHRVRPSDRANPKTRARSKRRGAHRRGSGPAF